MNNIHIHIHLNTTNEASKLEAISSEKKFAESIADLAEPIAPPLYFASCENGETKVAEIKSRQIGSLAKTIREFLHDSVSLNMKKEDAAPAKDEPPPHDHTLCNCNRCSDIRVLYSLKF